MSVLQSFLSVDQHYICCANLLPDCVEVAAVINYFIRNFDKITSSD